jgi:hypothetical protein
MRSAVGEALGAIPFSTTTLHFLRVVLWKEHFCVYEKGMWRYRRCWEMVRDLSISINLAHPRISVSYTYFEP